MSKRLRLGIATFFATLAVLFGVLATGPLNASATDNKEERANASSAKRIYKKALLNGLKTCYRWKSGSPIYLKKTVNLSDYTKTRGSDMSALFSSTGKSDKIVLLPSKVGNSSTANYPEKASCQSTFAALGDMYGKKVPANPSSFGYKAGDSDTSSNSIKCVAVTYSQSDGISSVSDLQTNPVCFTIKGGEVQDDDVEVRGGGSSGGKLSLKYNSDDNRLYVDGCGDGSMVCASTQVMAGYKWSNIEKAIESDLSFGDKMMYFNGAKASVVSEGGDPRYTLSSVELDNVNAAIEFYTGQKKAYSKVNYTDEDSFALGMLYINKYLENNTDYRDFTFDKSKCTTDKSKALESSKYIYHMTASKWCPLTGVDSIKKVKVNMIQNEKSLTSMKLTDVIEEMQKSKYNKMGQGAQNIAGEGSDDDDGGNDESNPTCYNAAGALGWVACPILDAMSTVVSGIYSYIEDSLLSIDGAQLLASNGSLHKAWGTFRDYANILFVILLALVILSQLTGIGLNNYSIKKMLPRLIVMVVLVNVSFIICQLAVDLSNIGGYSIRKFFTDAATEQGISELNMGTFADSLKGALTGGIGTVVTAGIGVKFVIENWDIFLVPVALFLITTIIAIIFFAIVLGVRQAGIIILVALTPVAIICYALPNTKKLFDKWFKLFSALLLVFPICGALMGGGLWASKLLLSTGKGEESFFFALVAMLLQVVPFFLVPSLVRGSLSVAGNIGTKISRAGSNIGGFASRQIRASEGVKDFQQRMGVHNAERKYKRIEAGKGIRGRIANNRFIGDTKLGRAAQSSMNRSARRYAGMVNKQTRDDIASEVGVNLIGDDERQSMLLNEMTERSQERMSNDTGFMNDLNAQKDRYSNLLDQIEQDPSNLQARADARALSSLMMKNFKGKGRDAVKNALSKRAYDHQQNNEEIGEGLASVANNLLQDNPALKGDDSGLHALVNNMAKGGKEAFKDTRFRFVAADPNIKGSEDSYYSAQYDATEAVGDFSAETLGKGNKRMLERVANALASGEVDEKTAATYSRLASQALSDPRINVPSENVDVLNQIMHNSAQSMGTNFLANNASSLTDTSTGAVYTAAGGGRFTNGGNDYEYDAESGSLRQVGNPEHTVDVNKLRMDSKNYITDDGRRLEHTSGNEYEYHYRDKDGNAKTKTYQRDATTGQFSEVGGSDIIAANKVSKAQDVFKNSTQSGQKYRYQRLENGQSLKVPRQKIQIPRNWTQDASGRWVDTANGFSPLTPAQLHQMDMINERNNQIEIDNMEDAANSGGQHTK